MDIGKLITEVLHQYGVGAALALFVLSGGYRVLAYLYGGWLNALKDENKRLEREKREIYADLMKAHTRIEEILQAQLPAGDEPGSAIQRRKPPPRGK